MKQLLFFPGDIPFSANRKAYFTGFGYSPIPYSPLLASESEVLLLATPVKTAPNTFVSPESVWKQYFDIKHPEIKIIQVGISERYTGPNYLNWLLPPADFLSLLKMSVEVHEGWQPIPTFGEQLEDIWALFWDGHDKEGFKDWFSEARRCADIVLRTLKRDANKTHSMLDFLAETDSVQAFENTLTRWRRYQGYFTASPFMDVIEETRENLKVLLQDWRHCGTKTALQKQMENYKEGLHRADQLLDSLMPYIQKV